MSLRSIPTRTLPQNSDFAQLRRQAKDLLAAFRAGDTQAVAEVNAHYRGADGTSFALHDAQLAIARAYGFESWRRLKSYVDGATAGRLIEAVRSGDLEEVRAMLRSRPELINMGMGGDEHRAIHHAVLTRSPEMTRLLMQHGADARAGVHPHRDATTALILAQERGYDAIAAVIAEEEQRRREVHAGNGAAAAAAAPEAVFVVAHWQSGHAFEVLKADPSLVHATSPIGGTPLHFAAWALHEAGVAWLIEHGADPNRRIRGTWSPIDLAAVRKGWTGTEGAEKSRRVARLLESRGAALGPFSAIALGDEGWIRDRHAEGALVNLEAQNPLVGHTGLLETAVWHDRPEILALLLELGLDPDERMRVGGMDEIVFSQGGPLLFCVAEGKRKMAEMLLARGADPNANVYTAGSPIFRAYCRKDSEFVRLLEQHGGFLDAVSAGFACQTEVARQLLAYEAAGQLRPGVVEPGKSVAEELLWTAAGGGAPEIVRMALEHIEWPREDPRWLWPLWQAFACDGGVERGLDCFRLLLSRADPSVSDYGRTMLHTVVARGEEEHLPYAELLLDAGARTDFRDDLLQSTPLGWACRWGRSHFVRLLLEHGADPVEAEAEPWATPRAWAEKKGHHDLLALLQEHGAA